jgi:parallel beta-helix repeat protein
MGQWRSRLLRYHSWRLWQAGGLLLVVAAAAVIGSNTLSHFASRIVHGENRVPAVHKRAFPGPVPAGVCGNKKILDGGPSSPPRGAVRVPAGGNTNVDFTQPHTVYWFAPGVHTLGSSTYAQILPGNGATFIGATGAVLDGQHKNFYAFGGSASDVKIRYLTIENFGVRGGNMNQGVVNHDSASGWSIDHSTITANAGAGLMLGSYNVLSYDCVSGNGQYGFNAYSPSGPVNLVLDHNQITGNDTDNWEARDPGCGCTGGGKFWDVTNAVITDNWIGGNHSVGLWADTDNRGFTIEGNYIADNYSYGIIYEISYNALIKDNTFYRNGIVEGPSNDGFPVSAIYLSESGADPNVAGPHNKTLEITGNKFVDNWSGVILWENSNRFCNSPSNTSTGACTLDDPAHVTLQSCNASNIGKEPYYTECRWKTQNVLVDHNVFDFAPTDIGSKCTVANDCGFQGIFSEWGTYPSWSPYLDQTVEKQITFSQHNVFRSNTYLGPWSFMALQLGDMVSWWQWQSSPYRQDEGSTLKMAN